jgi:DNA repair ATPase RecN
MANKTKRACSFCDKTVDEVTHLIERRAGDPAICLECVGRAIEMLFKKFTYTVETLARKEREFERMGSELKRQTERAASWKKDAEDARAELATAWEEIEDLRKELTRTQESTDR